MSTSLFAGVGCSEATNQSLANSFHYKIERSYSIFYLLTRAKPKELRVWALVTLKSKNWALLAKWSWRFGEEAFRRKMIANK